ncbi:MAG: Allophanate hydrolase [Candidatus Tokpelaia hoelldobleri]|uniref:Allophanate hydrolase n=1 Tax=Candidatus Tokpelaia hoelldobleri TaxID=1902579 RepID=A0A1U9JUP1_9HYPH|nr:MAG: Allophanate hydrolase [Candidatus Tokpelaia hoelldoblerii]
MRFLPVNQTAVLVELDTLEQAVALHNALMANPVTGIIETVPAARTVLVYFDAGMITAPELANYLSSLDMTGQEHNATQQIDIPVQYNGEDLAEAAGFLNVSIEELIHLHTGSDYLVAFTGFAPGFAYLSGGHPKLDVPGRENPRPVIPAGSVALAGTFSGIYPQASPGGWQLIGNTAIKMFDLARNPPALLQPGFRVRFHDAAAGKVTMPVRPEEKTARQSQLLADKQAVFDVCAVAMPVFYQDAGRPHMAGQGVSVSGAADRSAFQAANFLVGNAAQATVLEITLGGLELTAHRNSVIALSGAECAVSVQSREGHKFNHSVNVPVAVEAGDRIRIGMAERGLRAYLAMRGGFAAEHILGSSATDILAKLGVPLQRGDVLYCQDEHMKTAVQIHYNRGYNLPAAGETVVLDVIMGPRTDWFTPEALTLFTTQLWSVSGESSRVGNRLLGAQPLARARRQELPSEGTVSGAIQVPASGQPVLFLADHPLTGGYPVIACVAGHHMDLAAQIPVGARIRFHPVTDFTDNVASLNRHGREENL